MESELNPFERAHWSVVGQKEADAYFERKLKRKCDWSDPDDVREWRTELRRRRREARIPKNHRCPKCGDIKTSSKQWVVTVGSMVCKSCWSKPMPEALEEEVMLQGTIFKPSKWSFDARVFVRARERAGLSASEFARRMGWGRSYQSRIEGGFVREIDSEVAVKMLQVLAGLGVYTEDDLSAPGTTT